MNRMLVKRSVDGCYFLDVELLAECVNEGCERTLLEVGQLIQASSGENACGVSFRLATGTPAPTIWGINSDEDSTFYDAEYLTLTLVNTAGITGGPNAGDNVILTCSATQPANTADGKTWVLTTGTPEYVTTNMDPATTYTVQNADPIC